MMLNPERLPREVRTLARKEREKCRHSTRIARKLREAKR